MPRIYQYLLALITQMAFTWIKNRLQKDPELAWSWQCNVAMAFKDMKGQCPDACEHEVVNRAASAVMQRLFEVDVTEHPVWEHFENVWKGARK